MVTALGIDAHQLIPFDQKRRSAAGAVLSRGLLPGHKVTLRIAYTAVIFSSFLRLLQYDILTALGTGHADLLKVRFCVPALRKAGAGQEFAVGTIFDHQIAAAQARRSRPSPHRRSSRIPAPPPPWCIRCEPCEAVPFVLPSFPCIGDEGFLPWGLLSCG